MGDTVRTEFELTRTVCGCGACAINCEFIPGYLIPADLERRHWPMDQLLASPGALVGTLDTEGNVQQYRIPTIVPARNPATRHCVHLTVERKCAIHRDAPFGCAFFDAHQTMKQSDTISRRGLEAIVRDVLANGPYWQLWQQLWESGRRGTEPTQCRREMAEALYKGATL